MSSQNARCDRCYYGRPQRVCIRNCFDDQGNAIPHRQPAHYGPHGRSCAHFTDNGPLVVWAAGGHKGVVVFSAVGIDVDEHDRRCGYFIEHRPGSILFLDGNLVDGPVAETVTLRAGCCAERVIVQVPRFRRREASIKLQ